MKKLIVLGCGDAFASGGRHTTSFLVEEDGRAFLIDCGASTLIRLRQINYPIEQIRQIYITHFHGDHYGGLPFLLLSYAFQVKSGFDLTIFGPKDVQHRINDLQETMYPETTSHLAGLPIRFVEYNEKWQPAGDIEVRATPVVHSPPSQPHGLSFRWRDKKLSFSGDSSWNDNLIRLAEGSEVYITECNNLHEDTPGHLAYHDLIDNKDRLTANRIYLSHMSTEMLEFDGSEFEKLEEGMEIMLW